MALRTRTILGVGLLSGALLAAAACGGAGGGGAPAAKPAGGQAPSGALEKTSLNVGVIRGLGNLPVYVADAEGLYKQAGLDVKLVFVNGDTTSEQALVAGSTDIAAGSPTEPLDLVTAHQNAKAFWAISNDPVYDLYAPKGQTLQQLAASHAKVAVSQIGAQSQLVAQYILQKAGVDPKAFSYVALGGPAQRAAALESGQVQLVPATAPGTFILGRDGFVPLVRMRDVVKSFPEEVYTAKEDFLAKNHNTVLAFLKATIAADDWIAQHPDEAAQVLIKTDGYNKDEQAFGVDAVKEATPYFPRDGQFANEGMQVLVDFAKQQNRLTGNPPLSDFEDTTFIQALSGPGK